MTTDHGSTVNLDDVTRQANQEITESYDKRVYTSNAFPFSSPGQLGAGPWLHV